MSDAAAQLRAVKVKVREGVARGLTEGAMAVQQTSIPLTPRGETGHLRNSFTINPVAQQGHLTSLVLHYAIIYSRYQHEGVGFNFTTPGTGAKFLETAASQNEQTVKAILRNHIQGALR